MIPKQDANRDVDDLLRTALADDLPADVAAGMRERIALFRETTRPERPAFDRAWLGRRAVWAALSVLMLVAGILLQGAKASSPLADRIAALKTSGQEPGPVERR